MESMTSVKLLEKAQFIMKLIDTIEKLMNEYSNAVDYSFSVCGRSQRRFFKCSFCHRAYKYHSLLRKDFKIFPNALFSCWKIKDETH